MEGVAYYGVSNEQYDETYTREGYNQRAVLITDSYDQYGLTTSEKHKGVLEEPITAGRLLIEEENRLSGISRMMEEKVPLRRALSGSNYEMILAHTSGVRPDRRACPF